MRNNLPGAIACAVIGVANLQLPVYAATITYDFTIKLTPADPDTPLPGFSEFYNGFFSYDPDAAIAFTPSGDPVYTLTDFSFDFFAPPILTPKTYTLTDLRPPSFVIGTVPSGTPDKLGKLGSLVSLERGGKVAKFKQSGECQQLDQLNSDKRLVSL